MLHAAWQCLYFAIVRPLYKWLLHLLTGQCELLRITYRHEDGAERACSIESSLKHSKTPALKRLLVDDNVNVEDAVETVLQIKSVNPDAHPRFSPSLRACLCQICGYRQLIAQIETVRKTPYSSENDEHEKMLMQLWKALRPETSLDSRVSKQWTEIGFQGDDPATDFRGMGILGLQNLIYFVTEFSDRAKQMLAHSNHPKYGYSFAIVGINITFLTYQLLIGGHLKTHFYNAVNGRPQLEHFHQVYCCLLSEFDKFWISEKPRDIMEFNRIKEKFQKKMTHRLKDRKAVLSTNLNSPELSASPATATVSTPL